jgi:Tfp pilus assembly protein PilF
MVKLIKLALILSLTLPTALKAEAFDPFDPFDFKNRYESLEDDENKSAAELIFEASFLLQDERPLDARTKLLKALRRDPLEYKAHMMLAGYYMAHVGHFRLALKYVSRGKEIFLEKYGPPPYTGNRVLEFEHAHFLHLLSQARLNLDDYSGALATIEMFKEYGYTAPWYPSTRAWILMKLGRLQEALSEARVGVLLDSETGRTLNMLGILLSMTGDRQTSIEVFEQAIRYEMSLGRMGQPATPLNNVGEVFREIFRDDKAESSWLRATGLPDGCEHVLPSLNLALLYLEHLELQRAKTTMDNFESCVAQYPLRNGEEHRALVHLARGRIDLHSGQLDSAINHLEASLKHRQWFGKIGTKEEDLRVGAMISLAQALLRKNNRESLTVWSSWKEQILSYQERLIRRIRAAWLMRQARQLLAKDLDNIKDLHIRNTDSVIEYSTFGEALATFPRRLLERRINQELATDPRSEAAKYYLLYLAQNYIKNGRKKAGFDLIDQNISYLRPLYDRGLKTHILGLQFSRLDKNSQLYVEYAHEIFRFNRAFLRNNALKLPINYSGQSEKTARLLNRSSFLINNSIDLPYKVVYELDEEEQHSLRFISEHAHENIKVKSNDLIEAINRLSDVVFTQRLQ